jgi:hypothetical protein
MTRVNEYKRKADTLDLPLFSVYFMGAPFRQYVTNTILLLAWKSRKKIRNWHKCKILEI